MDDDYRRLVLDLVAQVPSGRAVTYGLLAELVAERLVAAGGSARGGPRQVGRVMAEAAGDLPWWRVVDAGGYPPPRLAGEALAALRAEATPLRADGRSVRLREAIWWPEPDRPAPTDPLRSDPLRPPDR